MISYLLGEMGELGLKIVVRINVPISLQGFALLSPNL
jgi:hypothetical protein